MQELIEFRRIDPMKSKALLTAAGLLVGMANETPASARFVNVNDGGASGFTRIQGSVDINNQATAIPGLFAYCSWSSLARPPTV